MKRKSFAKVNLALDVVKRLESGYHSLDMIMAPIDLFDTIEITPHSNMEFTSNRPFLAWNEKNSIYQALTLIKEKYQIDTNFKIRLMKNIPSRSGLGGGSSNAATVINILNELLKLKMSKQDKLEIALKCGADVPYCLFGKPAQVSGIGEKIIGFDFKTDFWMFLVKPNLGVSTKEAFATINFSELLHPNINQVKKALENNDYQLFINEIGNSLEASAALLGVPVTKIKNDLVSFGFDKVVMSGSGSSMIGFTQDEKLVDQAVNHYFLKYSFVKKTKIILDTNQVSLL